MILGDGFNNARALDRRTFLMGAAAATLFASTSGSFAAMRKTIVSQNGLEGTFLHPNGPTPSPAVLIIAGSGPTDRDGNNPMGVRAASYRMLADALAAAGIGSLRYDKRGIAHSAARMQSEEHLRIGMFVDDAAMWATWLGRQEGIHSVILVGHSEGALVASLVAKKTPVAGVVLLAAPGRKFGDIIRTQIADMPMPNDARAEANRIVSHLEAGTTVETIHPGLYSMFRPSVQPFLISVLKVNPAAQIQKLSPSLPVLLVRGGRDLQINQEDFLALARARPDAEKLVLPNMNHALKDVGEGREANFRAYKDPRLPLAAGLAEGVATFVAKHQIT
jgi:pimeloyl-ACP methyl ester carboxylesterase